MNLSALLFPGFMIAIALGYEIMAMKMPRGTLTHPGPGLYPTIVGVFLLATSIGCLVREILRRGAHPADRTCRCRSQPCRLPPPAPRRCS